MTDRPLPEMAERWFQDFIYRAHLTAGQSQELRRKLVQLLSEARAEGAREGRNQQAELHRQAMRDFQ